MCFTADFFFPFFCVCTWFEKMEAVTREALVGVALVGEPLDTCKFCGDLYFFNENV